MIEALLLQKTPLFTNIIEHHALRNK